MPKNSSAVPLIDALRARGISASHATGERGGHAAYIHALTHSRTHALTHSVCIHVSVVLQTSRCCTDKSNIPIIAARFAAL